MPDNTMSSLVKHPVDKDQDPAQMSKRKKQLDNLKTNTQRDSKRPKVEWTQSTEDLTFTLKLDGVKADNLKAIDVQFTDSDITVKLPDGRNWAWHLVEEIFREMSRVKVKKHKLTLHMKKKKPHLWENLEPIPSDPCPLPEPSLPGVLPGFMETAEPRLPNVLPGFKEPLEPSLPSVLPEYREPVDPSLPSVLPGYREPVESQSMSSTGSGVLPQASEGETTLVAETEDETSLAATGDGDGLAEEPDKEADVYELKHVKRDYIQKDMTFTVHIYVKGVLQDKLQVMFAETSFTVKFHTSNQQFLKLHTGTTEDTQFCWHVRLSGETVPEQSKVKLTPTLIELTLAKKKPKHWGDLEDLKCKDPAPMSKSDTWVSVNDVKAATPRPSSSMDRQYGRDGGKAGCSDTEIAPSSMCKDNIVQQKPTCKVQPLNAVAPAMAVEQVVRAGMTGLDNLGNTCFMNGVLQCLANTREFRDFFLDGAFQKDLNTDNILGSGGQLAVSFAVLLRVLWSGKHYSYAPSKLKNLVAQKASQFTGFAQHDAQEFLGFLLDGLHEDVNRVCKKPYTETVEDGGRPDEVVASEAWEVHKKRNDSFVVDLFQGQYKSKLVCPSCGKVSITFDPFLYLSLPLPKRQRLLPVTFMWKDPYRKPIRYMLRLAKEASVEQLKDSLHRKTGVNPTDIRVFEAYKGRINRLFSRGTSLNIIQASDVIIACEVLSAELVGEPVHEIAVFQRTLMPNQFPTRCQSCKRLCPDGAKLKRCTKCFKVGYCDQACQKQHWQIHRTQCHQTPEPVGTPFILSVPESRATFAKLCQLMEAYSRYSVDIFQPPVKNDLPTRLSSQLSSSSLSNSSQSSGSLNSLDSQSSFSSSCTITAEQEQDLDDEPVCAGSLPVTSDTSLAVQTSSCDFTGSQDPSAAVSLSSDLSDPPVSDMSSISGCDTDKVLAQSSRCDSGYDSFVDVSRTDPEANKSSTASCMEPKPDKELSPLVNPVIGIQSGESERTTPMFYIKPVTKDGIGLTGADGDRFEDKVDVPLDLTGKFFLSVDWKNNDRMAGYVLVQSKDLEFDNDSSMMTASLEENNTATLEQCLDLFTEPEILAPEEAWYCPSCKAHREATKQLSIWKLPHTLIIQLKRFSFRNFIWRDKIDKMVDFPTRGLDLSSFYIGNRPVNEPPPIYDLYGLVNHHGGILGGHYTAFVRCASDKGNRDEIGWRLCDDSRVSSISHEKNVITRAAYLLFYRRREVFIPAPSSRPVRETGAGEESDEDAGIDSGCSDYGLDTPVLGDLVIDMAAATPDDYDLPDLEELGGMGGAGSVEIHVPVLEMPDEESHPLGYTDMDSVD